MPQNYGHQLPNFMHGNKEAMNSGVKEGTSATSKEGVNVVNNDVNHLVEIFKNPSILFPKQMSQPDSMPPKINDVDMEADVALDSDRKRMREDDVGRGVDAAGRGLLLGPAQQWLLIGVRSGY